MKNVFYTYPNNSYKNEELENWFSLMSTNQIEITGHLPEGKWKPLQPDFNYLKRMEQGAVNVRERTGMDKYERRDDNVETKDDSNSSARVQVSDDTDIFLQQSQEPVSETFTTSRQTKETEGPTGFSSHMEL
ncbi:uncharacterized protein LOC111089481 [Limulus polyphemus]|uniref:Uncharacterized protein LOC111089481 n=1 Tax=Limulus polyphemus TaxID=6850 RepID=A0ABM1TPI8_LIMPO|nr:uncharacterized protein LOC111089481 [Limulus polyphemus]